MLLIPDTQEAIVPIAQWERVQELLDEKRRPSKEPKRQGLFSGLVFCADCGTRLYYHANPKGKTNKDSYYCGKYVGAGIEELTPTMVNEFVKKIIVHEADHSTGKRVQQIEIIFNFIGELDIPAVNHSITFTQRSNKKSA